MRADLIRSILRVKSSDSDHLIGQNIRACRDAKISFQIPEDLEIWEFVNDFSLAYEHPPEAQTVRDGLNKNGKGSAADRVDSVLTEPLRVGGDFLKILEEVIEARRVQLLHQFCRDAMIAAQSGLEIQEGKQKRTLRGSVEAASHLLDQLRVVATPTLSHSLSGQILSDVDSIESDYDAAKADPLSAIGQLSGLMQMDEVLRGARKGELWIHAAFAGHLKTTLALNWAYTQAFLYRESVLYFSLEVPYRQIRRWVVAMHSMHPKFTDIRMELGLQAHEQDDKGIEYGRLRDGSLTEVEEIFFRQYVLPDLRDPANEYGQIIVESADPDRPDITVDDLRNRAEMIYPKTPFGSVFVDHASLLGARVVNKSVTDRLNESLRDLKRFALQFRRGQTCPIVALFQINREGLKEAHKRKEKGQLPMYDLNNLSYASEAERCVPCYTLVVTKTGIKPISDVIVGEGVWSSTGWRVVVGRHDNGTRRIWKVTTDRGSVFEGTAPHRVRVVLDGSLGWKAVSDLTPTDYVISTFDRGEWPTVPYLLPPLDFRRNEVPAGRGKDGLCLRVPSQVTEDLAYLLGAWDGDGKKHAGGVAWVGNRNEVMLRDRIRRAFEATFGHPLPLHQSPSRSGVFDLVKWSLPLKRWFESVAGGRAEEIPKCVLRGNRLVVRAYLQGLFDTDGWVNNQTIVGIKMKKGAEGFLRDVQSLLRSIGIDSHFRCGTESQVRKSGKRFPYVSLCIRTRQGRVRFMEEVGFTEPTKQSRLLAYSEVSARRSISMAWNRGRLLAYSVVSPGFVRRGDPQLYPVLDTYLRLRNEVLERHDRRFGTKRKTFYNAPVRARSRGLVPRGVVEEIVGMALECGVRSPDLNFLTRLMTLQVMRVKSVEDTGQDAPVMDLEVDGDHEYQTGALLTHNSADVVTASYLDKEYAEKNRALITNLKSRDNAPFNPFFVRIEWSCRRMMTCLENPQEDSSTRISAETKANLSADLDSLLKH